MGQPTVWRFNHRHVLHLCVLFSFVCAVPKGHAQLSGSIDLQTVYSSNVMGTVQPAPDLILEPLINIRYDHELHPQKSLYASFDLQPYYYTVVPDRSYNYAALEVGYELILLRNKKAAVSISKAASSEEEEEVAEEVDSREGEEELANNTTLLEGDNIAVNGLSYESVSLREDNLLSEQVDYARKFTLVAHDEIQKNRKAYNYYSYNWLTVQPTYAYSPDSSHRYAGNYLFNSVYYPNDTLYTYLEHRIWAEGIVELAPTFVSHTTLGVGYRKYVHPVQIDTTHSQTQLEKSEVVSQSTFYQVDLGTGILWVLSDKNSEALYLKTTYSPGLTQASFIYTLNQGIRFAGNLIDNEFGYDKVGALGISKIRLPYDIDLGSTLDVEYKWYPYFKLTLSDNAAGTSSVLDLKRNDTYYDININASKTFEDDTKGFLTVFHTITPSVSLEYYNNNSSLKYFKYHEFLLTANVSCGI